MVLLRRLAVIVALCFWQGGAVVYAAVVIPTGARVLGSHRRQATITRHVTHVLHLAGGLALVPLGWDVLACRDERRGRGRLRAGLTLALALTLVGQAWLRARMEHRFDPSRLTVAEQPRFAGDHQLYVAASALQVVLALAFLTLTLAAWRSEDGKVARTGLSGSTEEI